MRQLTFLLLFHQSFAEFFNTEECVIDYRSLENMWEKKLTHDLTKCGYEAFKPPPQNGTEQLQVDLHFSLKKFKFNSKEQEFTAYTWTFMKWKDERLKWDPKDYDGLDTATFSSGLVWTPSIRLFNGLSDDYDYRYLFMPCHAESSGQVECTTALIWDAKCGTDLSDWPFDAQTCKLEFGPFAEKAFKIQLHVGNRAISMVGAEYGAEWDIMDYKQDLHQNSEKQFTMTFRLERHADVLSAIIIFPAYILCVLTLSTLLIDARSDTRLLMTCFSLMCHFYFLSELAADIPKHTNNSPRLLWYYRGSFVMTSLMIVVSYVLKLICRKKMACYDWIISFNSFVYTKIVRFIIWPRWETNVKDVGVCEYVKEWTDFANITNTVWIIVSVLVYISMYYELIPHPIPITF